MTGQHSPAILQLRHPRSSPPIRRALGLCAACEEYPTCVYAASASHVVLQCEEFTTGEPLPWRAALVPERDAPPMAPSPAEVGRGLCSSCEHRPTCTYTASDRVVLRCEEYV